MKPFYVKLDDPSARPGNRYGYVLDQEGKIIGDAQDYTYGGVGFAVHTVAFAGYVSLDNIVIVGVSDEN